MIEPVELAIVRRCAFKKKPEGKLRCARCDRPKFHVDHFGAPPSLNVLGQGHPQTYARLKTEWEKVLLAALDEAGLPRGLHSVMVEGEATFPDRAKRDQGNYRVILEKALGDALQEGGWLEDDDWSSYSFGDLAYAYEKGVSRTRLLLFPTP